MREVDRRGRSSQRDPRCPRRGNRRHSIGSWLWPQRYLPEQRRHYHRTMTLNQLGSHPRGRRPLSLAVESECFLGEICLMLDNLRRTYPISEMDHRTDHRRLEDKLLFVRSLAVLFDWERFAWSAVEIELVFHHMECRRIVGWKHHRCWLVFLGKHPMSSWSAVPDSSRAIGCRVRRKNWKLEHVLQHPQWFTLTGPERASLVTEWGGKRWQTARCAPSIRENGWITVLHRSRAEESQRTNG